MSLRYLVITHDEPLRIRNPLLDVQDSLAQLHLAARYQPSRTLSKGKNMGKVVLDPRFVTPDAPVIIGRDDDIEPDGYQRVFVATDWLRRDHLRVQYWDVTDQWYFQLIGPRREYGEAVEMVLEPKQIKEEHVFWLNRIYEGEFVAGMKTTLTRRVNDQRYFRPGENQEQREMAFDDPKRVALRFQLVNL